MKRVYGLRSELKRQEQGVLPLACLVLAILLVILLLIPYVVR